jgi:DNA-binding helix-hairpin-helix protein with protein kinase domain
MMVAASKGDENWNPFKWAVEEKGLDLKALADDPEYAETFANAQREHLKKVAEGEAMKKEAAENYQKSLEAIDAWAAENGVSDEQKNAAWVKVEQMLNDANVGKVPVEVFALLVNGGKHDADVAAAAEEGYREGLGKNVEDKLRRIPKPEKVVGRQVAEPQPKPKPKNNNPFLA